MSGSNSTSRNSTDDSFFASFENLDMSLTEWTILVACVVALWVVLSCCLAIFLGPDYFTCYLCEKQIPRR